MKALVTGCSGFIRSHLVEGLFLNRDGFTRLLLNRNQRSKYIKRFLDFDDFLRRRERSRKFENFISAWIEDATTNMNPCEAFS